MVTLWRIGALRRRRQADRRSPTRETPRVARRGATRVGCSSRSPALLGADAALAGLGFVALFILDPNTQLLGLCLGGGARAARPAL